MEVDPVPPILMRAGIKRELVDADSDSDEESPLNRLVPQKPHTAFVPSVVTFEFEIPSINLGNHVKIGDPLEVIVAEVQNPHNFVVHLKKFHFELKKLMARMLSFYSVFDEKYSATYYKFENNDLCAVLYETNDDCREWYRAKILDFSQTFGGKSKVLLIDYGITTEISNYNFKFLDECFAYLPVQAVRVNLAKIKPAVGYNWSEECCKYFYDLVFEKDLVAQVLYSKGQERCLGLELMYPGVATCISDMLIQQNFAAPLLNTEIGLNELTSLGELMKPEEIGKIRSSRSELRDCGGDRKLEDWYRFENRNLKKMFEVDDSEESDHGSSVFHQKPLKRWKRKMSRGRRWQPAPGPSRMMH